MQAPLHPFGILLRRYFYSGWAFLIPYLLVYLFYYWRKWPANDFSPNALGNGGVIPALLHIYWALHAAHILLAAIALHSWWKEEHTQGASSKEQALKRVAPQLRLGTVRFAALHRVAPWLFLALIFYIPGVYLEWPSDPWEHLRRITEWQTYATVGAHSAGYKSSYFFPYSLFGWLSPKHLLFWANLYYTGMCLLLAWQYYLFAKAVGLDRRWAFLSVVVNVLTFGNSCFSFYRYYGLASTIFSQIGAVALTRIVLEFASHHTNLALQSGPLPPGASPSPASTPKQFWDPFPIVRLLVSGVCLLALIALNHIQGLGIAGLGVMSVLVWRLTVWKRSTIFWLIVATVTLSIAAIQWWPRHDLIESAFRPQGWLNVWYGFNLLAWPSPAADRATQILGLIGLVNTVSAIILLQRNHVLGWLAITPVIALCVPFISIPFANSIAHEIIVYHRMLFAIPPGLALVFLARQYVGIGAPSTSRILHFIQAHFPLLAKFAFLTLATSIPSGGHWFNRNWHALSVTPQDLQMKVAVSAASSAKARFLDGKHVRLVATGAITNIFTTIARSHFRWKALDFDNSDRRSRINQPVTEPVKEATISVLSSRPTLDHERSTLTQDPLASDPSAWITVAGSAPEFVAGITDFCAGSTALQNPRGHATRVFTSETIQINPTENYGAELTIRRLTGTNAIAYLAIAWYDKDGRFLESKIPAPNGAGKPAGWAGNGTFSYFGLVGTSASTAWTTYRTSFGPNETAAMPPHARFARVGALLNDRGSSDAVVQLTNVRFWRKSKAELSADGVFPNDDSLFIVAPLGQTAWTYASQASQASAHWPAQQVATDLGGGAELRTAAHIAGAFPVAPDNTAFEVRASSPRPHVQ